MSTFLYISAEETDLELYIMLFGSGFIGHNNITHVFYKCYLSRGSQ